jgi:hypothetical protein
MKRRLDNNDDRGGGGGRCLTFRWDPNGGGLEDMTDGTRWRDIGKRKRLYKLWLIHQSLFDSDLPTDVIRIISEFVFSPFNLEFAKHFYTFSQNIHRTTLKSLFNDTYLWKSMRFNIGKMSLQFLEKGATGANPDHHIVYSRDNATNQLFIHKEKYSWTIYDYLMMLSEQETFNLDIGGVY